MHEFLHPSSRMQFISARPRMIGGRIAAPGQFAHHAQVRAWTANNELQLCAGSVITNRWILGAASCVVQTVRSEVWLGSVFIQYPEVIIPTDSVCVHDRYKDGNVLYNIALLNLRTAVRFVATIRPVLLATDESSPRNINYVSGFGDGNRPLDQLNRLLFARVQRIPAAECAQYFPGSPAFVCTRGYDKPQQCPSQLDAGAALVYMRSDNFYVQVGVFAVMESDACSNGEPVGYLDVSVFLPWIRSITGIV